MTFEMLFGTINVSLRAAFMFCMIFGLLRFGRQLNIGQRTGMGFAGGAALMTIPSTWSYYYDRMGETPFDGWTTSILMLGCITFFLSTMRRYRNHEKRNAEQVERSRAHLKARGKL